MYKLGATWNCALPRTIIEGRHFYRSRGQILIRQFKGTVLERNIVSYALRQFSVNGYLMWVCVVLSMLSL